MRTSNPRAAQGNFDHLQSNQEEMGNAINLLVDDLDEIQDALEGHASTISQIGVTVGQQADTVRQTVVDVSNKVDKHTSELQGTLAMMGVVTPPQVVAEVDDWNPTGLSTASIVRVDSADTGTGAGYTWGGIAGGWDGRVLILVNVGSYSFSLENEQLSSSAVNRFHFPGLPDVGQEIRIEVGGSLAIIYDDVIHRWRPLTAYASTLSHAVEGLGSVSIPQSGSTPDAMPTSLLQIRSEGHTEGNRLIETIADDDLNVYFRVFDNGTMTLHGVDAKIDMTGSAPLKVTATSDVPTTVVKSSFDDNGAGAPAAGLKMFEARDDYNAIDIFRNTYDGETWTRGHYGLGGLTGATAAVRWVGGTASGAPVAGTFQVGDFVISRDTHVYVCTEAGTPGTWVSATAAHLADTSDAHDASAISYSPGNLASTDVQSAIEELDALNHFTAYLTDDVDGGYKAAPLQDPGTTESSMTTAYIVADNTLAWTWRTDPFPGSAIRAGVWAGRFKLNTTGTKPISFHWTLCKEDDTVLGTSTEEGPIAQTTPTMYTSRLTLDDNVSWTPGDKLLIKLYVSLIAGAGSATTATTTQEGTTHARVSSDEVNPVTDVGADIFYWRTTASGLSGGYLSGFSNTPPSWLSNYGDNTLAVDLQNQDILYTGGWDDSSGQLYLEEANTGNPITATPPLDLLVVGAHPHSSLPVDSNSVYTGWGDLEHALGKIVDGSILNLRSTIYMRHLAPDGTDDLLRLGVDHDGATPDPGINLINARDDYDAIDIFRLQYDGTLETRGSIEGHNYLKITGPSGAGTLNRFVGSTPTNAPSAGTFAAGDWVVSRSTGKVYMCTTGGTPGTWTDAVGDHLADTTDAHDASAISIADVADQYTATDVEAALAEVLDAEQAHEADTTSVHAHTSLSAVGTDDHHTKSHVHTGDGSGTVAAGSITYDNSGSDLSATDVQAALSEIHRENDPGRLWIPTGALRETFSRMGAQLNNSLTMTSGTVYLEGITLYEGDVISSISFANAQTLGVGTHQVFGIYDTSRNLVAYTTDDTSTAWTANTVKTLSLTSPGATYTVPATARYYLAILVTVSSGNMPKVVCNNTVGGVNAFTPLPAASADTSVTALQNPCATLVASGALAWAYVS